MTDPSHPDPEFDAMTSRLLHREALRRSAREISTTSVPGLENVLAQISAEVTDEAAARLSSTKTAAADQVPPAIPRGRGAT